MKAFFAALSLAGAIQGGPASAQTAAGHAPAPSPLLGSWAVDVSRLPVPPGARPKSVTITFSDAGDGKWTTRVDIFGGDGSERHIVSTYSLDGTPAPVEGDQGEADIGAVKTPAPDVMVVTLGKAGNPASTRVYTVAPDGKTMIETTAATGADGRPAMRTNYFTRIE
jgi:hypothetical protein